MADAGSQLTMDQILSGEPVPEPEAAPAPEPAPEITHEEVAAAPDGDTAVEPQPEQEGATAAPEADDLPPWLDPEKSPEDAKNWTTLRTSAKDFRRQAREQAERADALNGELEALRREVSEMRREVPREPQREQPRMPSVEEDPEAHIRALRQEVETSRISQMFDRSEVLAVQEHGKEKVEGALERFGKLPPDDPLRVQMSTSTDPWNLVVAELDRRDVMSEIGEDPAQYRARVEAEIRAKVMSELESEAKAKAEQGVEDSIRQRLPRSMAKVSGGGQNASSGEWNGPAPMGEVLGGGLDRYS